MPLALELQGINAGYDRMKVLFDVSLKVPRGSIVAVLGPNAAGKTTLLRVASGLLRPTTGEVRISGDPVARLTPRGVVERGLCLIPEGRGIFPNLTVRENLLLHTHLHKGRPGKFFVEQAFVYFPALRPHVGRVAGTLSGGEQQMLAVSRAISAEPQILLLDEISMGLAPQIVETLFDAVRRLRNSGITIVMVEQLVEDALDMADYVVLIRKGRVRAVGEPEDIRSEMLGSYFGETEPGEARGEEPAAAAANSQQAEAGGFLVVTPHGSRVHFTSCPAVASVSGVRMADPDAGYRPCGLCGAESVPAAPGAANGQLRVSDRNQTDGGPEN
jgi:branched-chain amino acid transport system ATP-binding protein